MLHLDSQCSAGFSNLALPWLRQDEIQKKEKGETEREQKACVVYQILALPLAGLEMKGLLSCQPQQHPQSCLSLGDVLFLTGPHSFMMTPPIRYEELLLWSMSLSLFFLPFPHSFYV